MGGPDSVSPSASLTWQKETAKKITAYLALGILGFFTFTSLPHAWLINGMTGLIAVISGLVLHVFIHETGHLVMGKISGYGFISIRFFDVMFIKKNGKWTRKRFTFAGTAGQCLMSPPAPLNGKYPFVLYNLGGAMMDFIFGALFLAFYFLFSSLSYSWVFIILAAMGAASGLLNILPFRGSIQNDGYNTLTIAGSDIIRHAFWVVLNVNAELTKGCRFRDIPAADFDFLDRDISDSDRKNALLVNAEVYRFARLMDRREFKEAKAFAEHLLGATDQILEVQKKEFLCELLFLELIGACRKEEVDRLYTEEIKEYIKASSFSVGGPRLLYAYAKLFLHDDTEAAKAREKYEESCLSFPFEGEITMNSELIDLVDDLAAQ